MKPAKIDGLMTMKEQFKERYYFIKINFSVCLSDADVTVKR